MYRSTFTLPVMEPASTASTLAVPMALETRVRSPLASTDKDPPEITSNCSNIDCWPATTIAPVEPTVRLFIVPVPVINSAVPVNTTSLEPEIVPLLTKSPETVMFPLSTSRDAPVSIVRSLTLIAPVNEGIVPD